MNKHWNLIKTVVLFVALPLVATAAASAHTWLSDTDPLTVDLDGKVTVNTDQLGKDRIHAVTLNRAGSIEGRIASIDSQTRQTVGLSKLKVFFIKDGQVANETITDENGGFIIDGVVEGVYSFVATGENGFAAYGVKVVANDGSSDLNIMEAAAVSPKLSTVKQILENKLPREVADQIISGESNGSEKFVGSNRVSLKNGTLTGHVIPLLGDVAAVEGTFVHILKDDQQIAEVQADAKGSFSIHDLAPGVYDFVAAGPTGFAAVSFEAVQEDDSESASVIVQPDTEDLEVAAEPGPTARMTPADPISYQDAVVATPYDAGYYGSSLDVCLTCGNQPASYAYGTYDYSTAPIEYAGEAIGYGCASGACCGSYGDYSGFSSCNSCGGCGGFGGGFGGGGRLGTIAGLTGLALGIVAIADDDDPQPTDPGSMSPNN